MPTVVAVLDVPDEVTLDGRDHVCSGEEAVLLLMLLLLYRLRSTG